MNANELTCTVSRLVADDKRLLPWALASAAGQ